MWKVSRLFYLCHKSNMISSSTKYCLFLLVIIIFGKQNLNVTMFHNYTSNLIKFHDFLGQFLDEYNKDNIDNNYIFI